MIKDLYHRHIYSKAEYGFMKRFYDSIQPNLANPGAVLKIISNFENELQNSSNYLPVEKNQLESVMSIAKSSVQYWTYGNGHFKSALATEDKIPNWAERDILGAVTAIYGGYADYAYLMSGFNPIVGGAAILGMAAVSSMI